MTARPPRTGRGRGQQVGRPARAKAAHRRPRRGLSQRSRVRAFGILVVMGLAFLAIILRLTWLQGVGGSEYVAVGSSEWTHSVTLQADRGAILDRNGDELAVSVPQTTVYADPKMVKDPASEAAALSPVLGIAQSRLVKLLTEHNQFTYIDRTIPGAEADQVKKMKLPGIAFMDEPKRFYPAGQLARPLIGQTGTEDSGLSGLEYKYQSILAGKDGKEVDQTDPEGDPIAGGQESFQAPVAGQDLVLTLDEPLQYDAEQALAQAIVADKAQSGMALLMDRKTGDILADAELTMPAKGSTQPAAVPVHISDTDSKSASSPADADQPVEDPSADSFTQVYEPGSVNKLVTISGALQKGVVVPSDTFTIPDSYDVAGTPIHDAEVHGTQHWNVTDILANSSNIGTLQIAQRLGKQGLLNSIGAFGEGKTTDIDFPGESRGLLPSYWSGTTLADVSFGQGIGVTAVQVLAAYNAIANGGEYVAPRLVQGTIGKDGKEQPTPVAPGHRVVSPTVAAQMTTMLEEVVRVGTGKAASLEPYTVAGKTGTANIASSQGGYKQNLFTASFAGFAPAEDPSITAMVVINGTADYGASASAPPFASLMRDALQEQKVPPLPKQPPAQGVPLTNSQTATAAGESAGTVVSGTSVTPSSPSAPASTPASGAGAASATDPGASTRRSNN